MTITQKKLVNSGAMYYGLIDGRNISHKAVVMLAVSLAFNRNITVKECSLAQNLGSYKWR